MRIAAGGLRQLSFLSEGSRPFPGDGVQHASGVDHFDPVRLRISSSLVRRVEAETLWKSGCIGLILVPGLALIAPASFQFGFFPWKMLRWILVAVTGRNGWSCIPIVPTIWAATPRV